MRAAVSALVAVHASRMRRDRTAVVFLVILPIAIMAVLGNVYAAEDRASTPVALHVEQPGPVADLLVERLEATGAVRLVTASSTADVDDLVRRGHATAGLVVPAEVDAPGARPDGGASIALVGAPDLEAPLGLRRVVEGVVAEVDAAMALSDRVAGLTVDAALDRLATGRQAPEATDDAARRQAAIATLVLVTFMNLIAVGSLLPEHAQLAVLARLGSAPVARHHIVAGYLAIFAFVAGLQVVVAMAAGRLLLGIDWGPPGPVLLVAGTLALAAAALGLLAGTLLPSAESGSAVGGPVGFVLGMIGGCLWPLDIVGRPLQVLGRFTPHAWAVEGLRAAGRDGLAPGQLTLVLAVLLGTAAIGTWLGTVRLARSWR